MTFDDALVAHLHDHGYVLAPGAIPRSDIEAAQSDLFEQFPTPEEFASGLESRPGATISPFAGDHLQRLIVHPALVRFAETALETTAIRIYQAHLGAKYAGAGDYDQPLHPDYRNHTLLVPSDDRGARQLITWVLLSDVSPEQGATRVVSRRDCAHVPTGVPHYAREEYPELYAREVPAAGPAGTVFAYGPDVLHRGAAFTAPTGGRFTLTVSFRAADAEWAGYDSWPGRAHEPPLNRFLSRCSVRERELFGFPPPGHPYWTATTLRGVAGRYPEMDMAPYEEALTVTA